MSDIINKIIEKNKASGRTYVIVDEKDGFVSFFDKNAFLLAPKEAKSKILNMNIPANLVTIKKAIKKSLSDGWEY